MKRIFLQITIVVTLLLMFPVTAAAVQAYPYPIQVTQPDGTSLTIQLHGDEYLHWTTCNGRLVTRDKDGFYYYAQFAPDGQVQATSSKVLSSSMFTTLSSISTIRPPQVAIDNAHRLRAQNKPKVTSYTQGITKATEKDPTLVVFVNFDDVSFITESTTFNEMLNGDNYTANGNTGSVKQYYYENSNQTFTPEFILLPEVTISKQSDYFGDDDDEDAFDRAKEMFIEALNKLDATVDFSQYDRDGNNSITNIFFFYAGFNSAQQATNTIWPHAWGVSLTTVDGVLISNYACTSELRGTSGTTLDGIGTFCHEYGHTLGLDDVYDTDYSANGSGNGLGSYSLMSSGNYLNNSRTPPYLTSMERNMLGWMDAPTELTASGNYTLEPVNNNKAYMTPTSNPGETFIYENRQKSGWDSYLPGHGLIIYHSDKSGNAVGNSTASSLWPSNAYADHQCFDLVEAVFPESDATYQDQDAWPFPGTTNNKSFTGTSSPSATDWAGGAIGYSLTNIAESGSNLSFTLTVDGILHLSGTVTGSNGAAIAGATVKVTAAQSQATVAQIKNADGKSSEISLSSFGPINASAVDYSTQTNSSGQYSLEIPYGEYTLLISKAGYNSYHGSLTNIRGDKTINVVLRSLSEPILHTLQKYNGYGDYSYGFQDIYSEVQAAVGYTSSELTPYQDYKLNSITFLINGGSGTATETGVAVYVGNSISDMELQFSQKTDSPAFGSLTTVDVSAQNFTIPEDKMVLFAYYLKGSTIQYPFLTDNQSDVSGGFYVSHNNTNWYDWSGSGSIVISAQIGSNPIVDDPFSIAGYHTILKSATSYAINDSFTLELSSTDDNPTSVAWTVNGVSQEAGSDYTFSAAGTYVIKAVLTYTDRTESIVQEIIVPE